MKRKLSLLLIWALVMTAASVGCGGKNGGRSAAESETKTSQVIAETSVNSSSNKTVKQSEPSDDTTKTSETSEDTTKTSETSDDTTKTSETSDDTTKTSETSDDTTKTSETSEDESSSEPYSEPEPEIPPTARAVTLSKHEIYLHPGEQTEISYYLTPENAAPPGVTYYISNTSVYTVDPYGVITAVGPGKATLTADSELGLSDVCTITVTEREQSSDSPVPAQVSEADYSIPDRIVDAFRPYTSERVYNDINSLCDYYFNILAQFNIGESEKGAPIPCVTLGKGKKKALIVAGIHSREHISISFTMRCIEELADAYTRGGYYCGYDLRRLLSDYTLYIVPMCNPDGTDIATAGASPLVSLGSFDHDSCKFNANGVNLNRNFPYFWNEVYGNTKLRPGDESYPGTSAASEKETQALIKLCDENEFLWLLDMHILGNGIYWSDEGNGKIDGDYLLASSLASRCGYRLFPTTTGMPNYSSGLENWFRSAYKRPGLCVELLPYSQAYYTDLYSGYNGYFEQAVNWQQTRCTFLEAMSCMK